MSRRSSRPRPAGADDSLVRFLDLARERELPASDAEPLAVGEAQVPLVWRSHYVAVLFDGSRSDVTGQLADKGFEVITFGGDEAAWTTSLDQLAKALGRPA